MAVAHPQRLFAEALVRSLQAHADLEVSQEISLTGRAIVREVARRPPDVALVDFWIGDMAGPAAVRGIVKASPRTRVVLLTEFLMGPVQREQVRSCGASGLLPKEIGLQQVVEAVRAAAVAPVVPGDQGAGGGCRVAALTTREIEVLQVLRRGLSPREAAEVLSISAGTVKNHVHSILVKTKARTQVEAVLLAEEEGFISDL